MAENWNIFRKCFRNVKKLFLFYYFRGSMAAIHTGLTSFWTRIVIISSRSIKLVPTSKKISTALIAKRYTISISNRITNTASKERTYSFSVIDISDINRFRRIWSRLFIFNITGGLRMIA
jgi:cell division protein FtsL